MNISKLYQDKAEKIEKALQLVQGWLNQFKKRFTVSDENESQSSIQSIDFKFIQESLYNLEGILKNEVAEQMEEEKEEPSKILNIGINAPQFIQDHQKDLYLYEDVYKGIQKWSI
mmetsp:Transcript_21505/g.20665  ORF Transcript_21505/g.20665 Transcript_21505/m.20665 type:complete len:115 (+) Transcript_21505:467-811(+)